MGIDRAKTGQGLRSPGRPARRSNMADGLISGRPIVSRSVAADPHRASGQLASAHARAARWAWAISDPDICSAISRPRRAASLLPPIAASEPFVSAHQVDRNTTPDRIHHPRFEERIDAGRRLSKRCTRDVGEFVPSHLCLRRLRVSVDCELRADVPEPPAERGEYGAMPRRWKTRDERWFVTRRDGRTQTCFVRPASSAGPLSALVD